MIGAMVPPCPGRSTWEPKLIFYVFLALPFKKCKLNQSIGSAVLRHLIPTNFTPVPYMIGAMVPRQDNLANQNYFFYVFLVPPFK
jgi:hypothetical protein